MAERGESTICFKAEKRFDKDILHKLLAVNRVATVMTHLLIHRRMVAIDQTAKRLGVPILGGHHIIIRAIFLCHFISLRQLSGHTDEMRRSVAPLPERSPNRHTMAASVTKGSP
jgi:hypothetical protein